MSNAVNFLIFIETDLQVLLHILHSVYCSLFKSLGNNKEITDPPIPFPIEKTSRLAYCFRYDLFPGRKYKPTENSLKLRGLVSLISDYFSQVLIWLSLDHSAGYSPRGGLIGSCIMLYCVHESRWRCYSFFIEQHT